MVTHICLYIGLGIGLLPDSTKSLPEPMLKLESFIYTSARTQWLKKRCVLYTGICGMDK